LIEGENMDRKAKISIGEIIKTALSVVLIVVIIAGVLTVGNLCGCIYSDPCRLTSPDGEHIVTVRHSSPHPFATDVYVKIKVTAANDGWLLDTVPVSEKYSGVYLWELEWQDDDTALLELTGVHDTTITIDFSTGVPVFSE